MIILFDKNSSVKILFLIIPVDLKITTLRIRNAGRLTHLFDYGNIDSRFRGNDTISPAGTMYRTPTLQFCLLFGFQS